MCSPHCNTLDRGPTLLSDSKQIKSQFLSLLECFIEIDLMFNIAHTITDTATFISITNSMASLYICGFAAYLCQPILMLQLKFVSYQNLIIADN